MNRRSLLGLFSAAIGAPVVAKVAAAAPAETEKTYEWTRVAYGFPLPEHTLSAGGHTHGMILGRSPHQHFYTIKTAEMPPQGHGWVP